MHINCLLFCVFGHVGILLRFHGQCLQTLVLTENASSYKNQQILFFEELCCPALALLWQGKKFCQFFDSLTPSAIVLWRTTTRKASFKSLTCLIFPPGFFCCFPKNRFPSSFFRWFISRTTCCLFISKTSTEFEAVLSALHHSYNKDLVRWSLDSFPSQNQ